MRICSSFLKKGGRGKYMPAAPTTTTVPRSMHISIACSMGFSEALEAQYNTTSAPRPPVNSMTAATGSCVLALTTRPAPSSRATPSRISFWLPTTTVRAPERRANWWLN